MLPLRDLVLKANDRCNQENLLAQLRSGVRSLRAPVDNLLSNWAYMVMTSLAWNLKAWFALMLPERTRWQEQHRAEKNAVLRMEFKKFLNAFIKIPAQIIRTGRKLVYRLEPLSAGFPPRTHGSRASAALLGDLPDVEVWMPRFPWGKRSEW